MVLHHPASIVRDRYNCFCYMVRFMERCSYGCVLNRNPTIDTYTCWQRGGGGGGGGEAER